jgi:hypothetical protein
VGIVEGLVQDETIAEARIDASVERVARLFPREGHIPG